jgi:L-seryl-tRNA(Ser) seleniumtransferase
MSTKRERASEAAAAFRLLPSVEEVLQDARGAAASVPRALLIELVRAVLDDWREEIKAGKLGAAEIEARLAAGDLWAEVAERLAAEGRRGIVRVVNATGVVLHTGLGRAPVHPEVAAAMAAAASAYCVLEVDRESGERNERDLRLSELVVRATGAEAAIAVNNNAAAVLLALNTFAGGGREVIVSRGELVEIGGSFRVPDVMERAGARLREVGTTNRTRMDDYRKAAGPAAAMLMKVHTSNFRVRGFTHEVTADELSVLGSELGLATCFDLGSGLLELPDMRPLALGDEPRVREAVSSGVDLVTFSGDKLLGAPQAGLIAGKQAAVRALRQNPMYRAMRCDKVTLAGLERTFDLVLAGRGDELPARRMLLATAAELRPVAERLAAGIAALGAFTADVRPERSQPGSGSAPDLFLDTFCARVTWRAGSVGELAARLRRGHPPLFARVQDDALWLDPRTLLEGDLERAIDAFRALA